MTADEALSLMDAFAQAWNRHDCTALLDMMTNDAVFETAIGTEVFGTRHSGPRHSGHKELGRAFSAVWEAYPDASWNDAEHHAFGDRGFSEWTFRGTDRSGQRVEVRGVDLFVFREGKIAKKDTFRKSRAR